jgi:hypothetical protein
MPKCECLWPSAETVPGNILNNQRQGRHLLSRPPFSTGMQDQRVLRPAVLWRTPRKRNDTSVLKVISLLHFKVYMEFLILNVEFMHMLINDT